MKSISNQSKYLLIDNPPQQPTKPLKTKPIFPRKITWRCMTPSDISYINKYKPKMLSRVSISSLCSEALGLNGLRNLRKAFKDSKTVSSVFSNNLGINSKQLTNLLSSTNHWRSLRLFSLRNRSEFDQELIKTLPNLGRYKKLNNFPIPILSTQENIDKKIIVQICQQLEQLNKLKSLNLALPVFQKTSILNVRLPRSLTSIRLDLRNKSLISQRKLSSFVTSIQRCSLLEQLTLSFSQEYKIEPLDAQIWTSFFQNTPKSLKDLHIRLWFSVDQQLEGINAFIESLKYLKNLSSLTLSSFNLFFHNQPLPFLDGYFSLIFATLQSLTQLEKLGLRFCSNKKKIKNFDIQHLSSTLQCLKNLKSLEIDLPPLQFPDKNLISIAESLRTLNNLKALNIVLLDNFSHQSMQILSKSISHLHLITLNLEFGDGYKSPQTPTTTKIKQKFTRLLCFLKHDNSTPFLSDLQNLTQLLTLKLQFSSFDLSNHHTPPFEKFNRLSSLYLTFPQLKNFQGFQKLLSCLKDLPKLVDLNLLFEGGISDREVEILSSNLAGCQSLSSLNLRFKKAAQLKDSSLLYLLPAIRGLLKLQYLTLLFVRGEPFGEKAVSEFLRGLTVLKYLSRFYFIYNLASMFRSNSALLPPNLKNYENLRHLINFVAESSRYI